MQRCKEKEYWYTDTLQYAHKYLINYSKEKYSKVIKYVQYFMMYEIQWRLKFGIRCILTAEKRKQYIEDIKYILKNIDDDVIINQKNIDFTYKLLAFLLKYGKK